MNLVGSALRPQAWVILCGCVAMATLAHAQEQSPAKQADGAAPRADRTAAAFQKRQAIEQAAPAWKSFVERFPKDPRAGAAYHYLGFSCLKNGDDDQAIAALRRVVEKHADFEQLDTTYLYLGIAQYHLAESGQPELFNQAAASFSALLKKFPKSKHAEQTWFQLGESLYAAGQVQKSTRAYQMLTQRFPKSPFVAEALYGLGVAHDELGSTPEAAKVYARFVEQFPRHGWAAEVTMRHGETLVKQGQLPAAERQFAKAAGMAGFQQADRALLRQADCLAELQRHPEAAEVYASVPRDYPDSDFRRLATLSAGESYYRAGKYAEARGALEPLLSAPDTDGAQAAHWIALSWLKEGQADRALQVIAAGSKTAEGHAAVQLKMDRAEALSTNTAQRGEAIAGWLEVAQQHQDDRLASKALYLAALTAMDLSDYQQSHRHATEFLKRHSDHELSAEAMYIAAESLLQSGKYAEGEALYRQLIGKHAGADRAAAWRVRQAWSLFLQDKFDETIATLDPQMASLSAGDLRAEALYLSGMSHNKLAKFNDAIPLLVASLKAAPQGERTDATQLALASAYRSGQQLKPARATVETLVARFPDSRYLDQAYYQIGECAYELGDFAAAAAAYRSMIDLRPKSALVPNAKYHQGWALLKAGKPAEAVNVLGQLIEQHPAQRIAGRGRYVRALALHGMQQYADAEADLRAFLQTDPPRDDQSDALYVLGLCQGAQGHEEQAVQSYRSLLTNQPSYKSADRVYYELAWSLRNLKQNGEATETFGQLAKRHPDSALAAEALHQVGQSQYDREDFDGAASSFAAARQKAGTTPLGEQATHMLGWAHYRREAFEEAHQILGQQRKTFPKGEHAADAAFLMGECRFRQTKYAEALAEYAPKGKLSTERFDVLKLLHSGQAAAQLQNWQQSEQYLTLCVKRYPKSPDASDALYELAWAQQNLGRLDDALKTYERVTTITNSEAAARARFMTGEIHFQRKEHAEAVRHFFTVAYAYPYPQWQAAAHYEAGRCFEVLEKLDQARKSYREIIDKYPNSEKAKPAQERLDKLSE
jgi:TolA-binding protein